MKTILVPVDGSQGAGKAVRFAGDLARNTRAKLTLLYVYDAPTAAQVGLARRDQADFDHAMKEVSAESFAAADRILGDASTDADHKTAMGHPAAEIVTAAGDLKADLVVMGCRGRSEFEAYLLGSVSERVLRHAPCPVTVVR
jgi:nucleotide-binding universal stress UspA family protein